MIAKKDTQTSKELVSRNRILTSIKHQPCRIGAFFILLIQHRAKVMCGARPNALVHFEVFESLSFKGRSRIFKKLGRQASHPLKFHDNVDSTRTDTISSRSTPSPFISLIYISLQGDNSDYMPLFIYKILEICAVFQGVRTLLSLDRIQGSCKTLATVREYFLDVWMIVEY